MTNTCTFLEFWQEFCSNIYDEFEYIEFDNVDITPKYNIYRYIHRGHDGTFQFRLSGMEKRTPENITKRWIGIHIGPCNDSEVDEFVYSSYLKVNIKNLKSFIGIIKFSIRNGLDFTGTLVFDLINIHLNTPNIDLYTFGKEYSIFYYRNKYLLYSEMMNKFTNHIKELSNNKISNLWDIWTNYSGNYQNYIEWFPRVLVEDLIAIQHDGKYQPDYTTYIE